MSKDPRGHKLFKARVKDCAAIIESMMEVPSVPLLPHLPYEFTVTGVGSSEAHARFFTTIVNEYSPATATFMPLSKFATSLPEPATSSTLVIFSQGLSPNSLLALNQRAAFEHTILFTATSKAGAITKGDKHIAKMLQELHSEGSTIVTFPLENEYDLLIRTIGPMAGYMAVIQFLNMHWKDALPGVSQAALLTAIGRAKDHVPPAVIGDLTESLHKGSYILSSHPTSQYTLNLSYKISEGLFVPMPAAVDSLSFAHGPFQELCKNPKPVIILDTNSRADKTLFKKMLTLLDSAKAPYWQITSSLPHPYSILEYEAAFNHFVAETLAFYKVNQVNWPGKGLDSPLYSIKDPLS